jgi:hypothetical protein
MAVPSAYFLRLALIAELLRQRRWLAGLMFMVAGEILSAWVFGHLDLSIAEPLQAAGLVALVAGVILVARAPVLSGPRRARPAPAGDAGGQAAPAGLAAGTYHGDHGG